MKKKVAQKMFVGFGYVLKDEQGNIIGYQRSSAERIFKYISLAEVASEDDICYIPEHVFDKLGDSIEAVSLICVQEMGTAMTIRDMRSLTKQRVEDEYGDIIGDVDVYDIIVDMCLKKVFDSLSGKEFSQVIEETELDDILTDALTKKGFYK